MASIERTAYPRFKRRPTAQELTDVYTPTPEEVAFARATARGPAPTLTLLVLLKAFQRLGYFPRLQDVPFPVLAHVRSCLRLPPDTTLEVTPRTLYRHHQSIREFLQVTAWGAEARHVAITAVHQAAQATAHMLSFVNRRHVSLAQQDAALRGLINAYHRCDLPKVWGSGTSAAADGTKYDLAENSLLAEYSIRYGGYGGIAYHHVADTYVALFSHFIYPCGVREAIYIIEGLLKNTSEVQPTTVHSDTQGQSTPVYALAHLLGIQLMPRIRNWQDLRFYRPSKDARYKHIDPLFSETIDWGLIETHWRDLMQVVLSIKAGTVSSVLLLVGPVRGSVSPAAE